MKKRDKKKNSHKIKNLINIPNSLTLARVILSLVLIYLVFMGAGIWTIVIIFSIAALTDAADGFIARRWNRKTEFGRIFDITADRILMISILVSLAVYLDINNKLSFEIIGLFLLTISREIISAPFALVSFFNKKLNAFPQVRLIGKLTTLMQGITLPTIILGWGISYPLAILTCVIGIISGIFYARDSVILRKH